MEITSFITPRQVGKTKKGIYHFMTDPDNTLFVVVSKQNEPKYLSKNYPHNIKSVNQICNYGGLVSHRFKRAILDEYLFYDVKYRQRLHDELERCGVTEVIILTTPFKCYDKFLFEYIKHEREIGFFKSVSDFIDDLKRNHSDSYGKVKWAEQDVADDIEDLYYNYLTHPRCRIYDAVECLRSGAFLSHEHEDRLSSGMYNTSHSPRTEGHGEYIVGHTNQPKK